MNDLPVQVHNAVNEMGRHLPRKLKSLLVTGGGNPKPMEQALRGGVDIITGTPSERLHAFNNKRKSNTKHIHMHTPGLLQVQKTQGHFLALYIKHVWGAAVA